MFLRTLAYSGTPRVRGDQLWRELLQAKVRDGLAHGRLAGHETGSPPWQAAAREWVTKALACLRRETPAGPPPATMLDEKSHAGFRVQRWVLEAMPRWLVGLDLFLPPGPGPFPVVLCPCGHGPKWLPDHQVPPQVLARHGFAAALFDMPMFGERGRGNDHFIQGPQSAMAGLWSGFYFLVDILRAADYLETRADMDCARGYGVTGVSGGGMATLFMPLADPRVRVIVPVCCLAPLGAHVVEGLYTGCQENYLEGMAAAGLDLPDLLCLSAFTPCLAIAGLQDELFRRRAVEGAFRHVEAAYARAGQGERLHLYQEDCGHCYTAGMAGQAAAWFRRWLAPTPAPALEVSVQLLNQADLDCGTGDRTASMLELTTARVRRLAAARPKSITDRELAGVLRINPTPPPVDPEVVAPPTPWGPQGFQRFALHTPDELPLPVTAMAMPGAPAGTVLAVGDAGTLAVLRQAGGLGALRRLMLAADIRGYGELAPEAVDYDFYGWCGVDRALGDLLYLLGETALGQQARDVLRLLTFAQARAVATGADAQPLCVYARGSAALPVLLGSVLFPGVAHIALDGLPASLAELATVPRPAWNRYHLLAHALELFDLPELLASRTDKRFLILDPRGADGQSLSDTAARDLLGHCGAHVALHAGAGSSAADLLGRWLAATPAPSHRCKSGNGELRRFA